MAQQQQLIWTALPNGFKPGSNKTVLRLSVYASPRLFPDPTQGPQTLAQFKDFKSWPDLVKSAPFTVRFHTGPKPKDVKATTVSASLDPALWPVLFPLDTPVRPFKFGDLDKRRIRSYPSASIAAFVEERYRKCALLNGGSPFIESLLQTDAFGPINLFGGKIGSGTTQGSAVLPTEQSSALVIDELLTKKGALSAKATAGLENGITHNFVQARLFHKLLAPPAGTPPPKPPPPDFDFHDALSCLGDYPGLLRALGIVVDLEVPFSADLAAANASVVVFPTFASALGKDARNLSPRTVYKLSPGQELFVAAASEGSDLRDGLLKLGGPAYQVMQFDVDSAVELLLNFVYNLRRTTAFGSADTPQQAVPPALRTAGLSLVRTDRAVQLLNRLQLATKLNDGVATQAAADALELHAEDLVRGQRIDVLDVIARLWAPKPQWRSLCLRVGTYNFTKGTGASRSIADEGFISAGVSQSADSKQPRPDLFLHESICRWDGWSLSARRPGKTITQDEAAEKLKNKAETFFKLEATFKAQSKTLPSLRFGRRYRLRARAVDLAGNSLPPGGDAIDAALCTSEVTYARFEPVGAPVVVSTELFKEGESLERVVIRSTPTTPAVLPAERHLAPPRCSPQLAEQHGVLDGPGGLRSDAYKLITERDKVFHEDQAAVKDPSKMIARAADGTLLLPYLPDPLSRGAALTLSLNLTAGKLLPPVQCDFDNIWTRWLIALGDTKEALARPWRLLLVEHTAPPLADAAAELRARVVRDDKKRAVKVGLRKAEVARLQLSSYMQTDDVRLMGVWQWLISKPDPNLPPDKLKDLQALIALGYHPMFTPPRELTLVHAVQRPLSAPVLGEQTFGAPARNLGETFATLSTTIPVDGKSTGKLDLYARWNEPFDDPSQPSFDPNGRQHDTKAHVLELPLPDPAQNLPTLKCRHEFGDTKFREVSYQVTATTRFREYFPLVSPGPGSVEQTASSAEVTRKVLNSARPAAPKILYVVPTFGWDAYMLEPGTSNHRRTGGGLRVYMERPWYSSGSGELLAVVLPPAANKLAAPPESSAYVSRIGVDPTRIVNAAEPLTPASFILRKKLDVAPGLTLEELPGVEMQVVPHDVEYDGNRNLWFCDIIVKPVNSYYPFVRLALARYQPNSVNGAHLSRVVLTDFAQLPPERNVTVVRTSLPRSPTLDVGVTVSGVGHAGSFAPETNPDKLPAATQLFTVALEKKTGIGGDELGWKQAEQTDFFTLSLSPESAAKLKKKPLTDATLTWEGMIRVDPALAGSGKARLVIREYENYVPAADMAVSQEKMFPRLVFREVVPL